MKISGPLHPLTLCAVLSLTVTAHGRASELATPFCVEAGGAPIDVEVGHATPLVADFDGDGVPDLLVGQFGGGKLRLYRNLGTARAPRFEAFSWFQAGGRDATVPIACCVAFGPQLADLDGDGRVDLLTGSYPGEIYWFRRRANGTYAAPETLRSGAERLNVGQSAALAVTDWDSDGDFDLVIGNIAGEVWLVTNSGTPRQPDFCERTRLAAANGPIHVSSCAGPTVADWDGDQLADLLVGNTSGAVVWYRNEGSRKSPRLAAGRTIIEPWPGSSVTEEPPTRSAMRAKPCVADWNGDGRPDLLVGDFWVYTRDGARTTHGHVWVYLRRPQ